ncbi:MAG: transglutaminase-like domain-containing protein [Clostridiales bacterium]|nr:transglutaminase-like domain-containing protein [Clostridiales bacterium]
MLYNDYYRRMSKLMTFARAVKKHMLVILLSIFAVLAVTATLLATRGLVYDRDDCPAQVEYGQSISYTAGAFLAGDVAYEYRADGSTEWGKTPPTRAGKYYVRAVSSRTGGAPSYGKVHAVTILPKKIDVSVGNTTVFGENPSVTAELSYGDTIDCTGFFYADPSRNATTVKAVAESVVITDKNGEDVTYCYDISTPTCPIVFTPRKIGVTVADRTAEYDNTPKAFGGYELSSGTLADGNMLVCVSTTTLTDVGEVSVNPSFRVLNGDGVDVSANYDIAKNTGKISVTQRIVYVTSGSAEGVYSGSGFSCADYEITGNTSVVSGHRLSLELHSSLTDAGECENMMAFKVYDGNDKDISSNYSIVLTAGTLTVTPRAVTVKSADKSWEYDGAAHSYAALADNGIDGLVKGHSVLVNTESAVITDAGTADNDITVTIVDGDGTDKTGNYKIAYDPGTLTVTRKTLTVITAAAQFVYDGNPHGMAALHSVEGLIDGHSAMADNTIGTYTTITDVGIDGNEVKVIVSDGYGVDKTHNYSIMYMYGVLRVNERPITVKAADVSREYDGTPFTSDRYEIISDYKLVEGHVGVARGGSGITNVGTFSNVIVDFMVFDGETEVTGNYAITFAANRGTLTVTPRVITVKSVDAEFTYDGTAKFKNEIESVDRLLDIHTICVNKQVGAYATITDVGTADNDILTYILDADGIVVSGNYKIIHVPGTLTVKPRPVTVKSASLSKIYDATPLIGEADDFEVVEGDFVLDHNGSAYYDIGRIGVGKMPNVIDEFSVFSGETDVTKNYKITISEEKGTLTVTPRPIKVIADDKDKKFVYDGEWHGYFGCTIVPVSPLGEDDDAIVGGQTVQRIAYTSATLRDVKYDEYGNVTGINNNMFIVINDGEAVTTQNYQIEYDLGTITVTPRPITVRAGSDSKIYDGTPLTSNEFVVTSELGIVKNQIGVAECNGSITEVGTANNTIEHNLKVYDGDADKTANYDITYDDTPNTLTVEARPITVTTKSHTFTYDGNDHDWKYFDVTPTPPRLESTDVAIISTHHAVVDESDVTIVNEVTLPDATGVSGTPNRFNIFVLDENGEDKTYNYDIVYVYQRIWVRPRPIRVCTESKEFLYDDADHSHVEYTIAYLLATDGDDKPIIDKHKDEVVSFTTVHDVMRNSTSVLNEVIGTDNNIVLAIKDKATSNDVTYNYDIFYVYGELTVNPRTITVTTWSQTFMYDDTEHSFLSYTISNRAPLAESEPGILSVHKPEVDWYTEVRDVMRDINGNILTHTNAILIKISKRSDGVDQTHNYDIQYVYGKLTVTPRPIEITTGSQSWIFDGMYHSNTEYSAKALFELNDGETALASGHKIWLVNRPVAVRDVKRDRDGNVIGYENNSGLKVVRESDNANTTTNYEITYNYGTLTITPRHITVRIGREEFIDGVNSWVYDGEWHKDDYAEIVDTVCDDAPPEELEKTGLLEGHVIEYLWTSVCEVNRDSYDYSYINRIFITSIKQPGALARDNDMSNYQIHYIYGKLRILPRPITIYTSNYAWSYDGQPHSDYQVTVDENTPLANGNWIVNDERSVCEITEVGKKQNKFGVVIYGLYFQDDSDSDFVATGSYEITYVYGELEIVEGEVEGGDNGEHGGNIGGGGLGGGSGEGGGGDGEPKLLFTISTNYNGHIYLRQNSYGDYVLGQSVSFLDAEEFNGLITVGGKFYGMNYLPTTILQNSVSKYYLNVQLEDKGNFVVPYFAAFGDTSQIQTSDVWYYLRGNELSYTLNFHPYMYANDHGSALSGGLDWRYSGIEREYYNFVLSKYLQIPDSTKRYMDGIIAEQNFSLSDPDIISKVAQYIQNSAAYNLEYDTRLDSENDIVVEFLRKYKQGVCRHYAAAATMLFRAIGIPARYVCGVSANGDGTGSPIQVTSDRAHGWTEVYIAGIGWIPVEVTSSNSMGSGGGGGGYGDNIGNGKLSLTIKPIDVYVSAAPAKPINAVIQTAGNVDLNYLINNKGYYYDVVVEQTAPGVSEIKSFKLYNLLGEDVTSELEGNITFLPGKLVVTNKKHITVEMSFVAQTYNGTPLKFEPEDYIVIDAPIGYTVTLDLSRMSMIAAGKLTTEGLRDMLDSEYGQNMWYTVLNAEGVDVTSEYFISFIGNVEDASVVASLKADTSIMTVLEVSRRRVEFTSTSVSKKYDGTPLEGEVTYSQSELAAGHKAVITKTASIIDVGETVSTFEVKIVDGEGVDVTDNYIIVCANGMLTVTE